MILLRSASSCESEMCEERVWQMSLLLEVGFKNELYFSGFNLDCLGLRLSVSVHLRTGKENQSNLKHLNLMINVIVIEM